uniref:Uncharacterized protein n=1 Tax=Micrurus corallinus TaxID=54390 RepID=A0A2D4EU20_MICCO
MKTNFPHCKLPIQPSCVLFLVVKWMFFLIESLLGNSEAHRKLKRSVHEPKEIAKWKKASHDNYKPSNITFYWIGNLERETEKTMRSKTKCKKAENFKMLH